MANQSSQIITDLEATPVVKTNPTEIGGRMRVNTAVLAFTSGAAADVKRFTRIPSRAVVVKVEVANDDLDSNATPTIATDIGLYRTTADGAAVVDADFFASAVTALQAAVVAPADLTYESGVVTTANRAKRVWEQLGLSADPKVDYDVAMTLTTAAATFAAGSALVRVSYLVDE